MMVKQYSVNDMGKLSNNRIAFINEEFELDSEYCNNKAYICIKFRNQIIPSTIAVDNVCIQAENSFTTTTMAPSIITSEPSSTSPTIATMIPSDNPFPMNNFFGDSMYLYPDKRLNFADELKYTALYSNDCVYVLSNFNNITTCEDPVSFWIKYSYYYRIQNITTARYYYPDKFDILKLTAALFDCRYDTACKSFVIKNVYTDDKMIRMLYLYDNIVGSINDLMDNNGAKNIKTAYGHFVTNGYTDPFGNEEGDFMDGILIQDFNAMDCEMFGMQEDDGTNGYYFEMYSNKYNSLKDSDNYLFGYTTPEHPISIISCLNIDEYIVKLTTYDNDESQQFKGYVWGFDICRGWFDEENRGNFAFNEAIIDIEKC